MERHTDHAVYRHLFATAHIYAPNACDARQILKQVPASVTRIMLFFGVTAVG